MIVHDADLDEAKPVFIDTIKEEFNNSPDTTYGKESVMGVNNKRSYIKIIQQVMFEWSALVDGACFVFFYLVLVVRV